MDAQEYPVRHFEQMTALSTALRALPAQVLEHTYTYESFGSWVLVLRFKGTALRITFDGKERYFTMQRSTSRKAPYEWGRSFWEHSTNDDGTIEALLIAAIRSAPSTNP